VLIAILSYFYPGVLSNYGAAIMPLLGVVMLGMGMTLRPENFRDILLRPKIIGLGLGLQFLLMPLFGYLVGSLLGLSEALLIGLVLVGSAPGGTASNVICYLAKADVALSITLTTLSTILAVIMTPVLTWLYLGERVPVPVADMMVNIFLIILLPVTAGVLANHYYGARLHAIKHYFPYLSALAVVLIIGIIVAMTQPDLPKVALPVAASVFWHNVLGLASGYFLARLLKQDEKTRRTIAIEVGMQNSGLAVALAQTYFTPLAALPGALFSIWHNISGSILAGYWARKTEETPARDFT
jgi:BASS family bile acid:Na+ symporter